MVQEKNEKYEMDWARLGNAYEDLEKKKKEKKEAPIMS